VFSMGWEWNGHKAEKKERGERKKERE